MDEEQTIRIGLFPEQFRGHITMIGNSALAEHSGICSTTGRRQNRGLRLSQGTHRNFRFAMHPKFNELYLDEMFFDTDR